MPEFNNSSRTLNLSRIGFYALLLVGIAIGLAKSLLGDNSIQSWAIFTGAVIVYLGILYRSVLWLSKPSLATQVYRSLFNQSNEAIFILDLDGQHVAVNHAATKMLGYLADELKRLSFRDIVLETEIAGSEDVLKMLLAGQEVGIYERIFRKKNGELLETELNVQLIRDEQGNPLYILSIARDISDRKRNVQALKNSEERLRSLASALPDRVVILDSNGIYRDILQEKYETSAFETDSQVIGRSVYEFVPDRKVGDYFIEKIRDTLAANKLNVVEYEVAQEDKIIFFDGRIIPYDHPETGEKLVIWISRDITERKLSEQVLKNSEERLRAFASALPDRVIVLDKDGRYQDILQHNAANFLYPVEARVGRLLHDIFEKEFADFCLAVVKKALATREMQIVEYERMVEGQTYFIEARISPFKDPQTDEYQVIWVSRNITEQKTSLQALEDSEERLRTFVNTLPDRAVVLDKDGRYLDVLKASQDTFAFQPPNIIGKTLYEVLDKEFADFCYQAIQETLQSNSIRIFEYNNMNQENLLYLEGRLAPIHDSDADETQVLWITRDITKHKNVEQQLEYRNRFQRLLISLATDFIDFPVAESDAFINKLLEQIAQFIGADRSYINWYSEVEDNIFVRVGYEWYNEDLPKVKSRIINHDSLSDVSDFRWSNELLKDFEIILIPCVGDLPPEAAAEKQALSSSGVKSGVTIPLVRNNKLLGSMGFHAISSEKAWTADTVNLLKIAAQIYLNALERKESEQALSDSEQRLRLLIQALPDRMIIFDEQGYYKEILKAPLDAADPLDIIHKDLTGLSLHEVHSKEFADFCLEKIRLTLETDRSLLFEYPCPVRGEPYRFEARTIPFKEIYSPMPVVLWIVREITERVLAEQGRLDLAIAQEKNNVLRQFVDSMAHDLKSPLSVINTSSYLLGRQKDQSRQAVLLERITKQVDLLSQMLDDMLAVARLDHVPEMQWEILDLVPFVQDIVDVLQAKAAQKQIQLDLNFSQTSLKISASVNELRRALTNVIDNAIKYTPDEGSVIVDVFDEHNMAVIKVKDTGIGIEHSALDKVFNRFFRTNNAREAAPGTGLGLEITQRIIEFHKGRIEVESELEQGSTFVVYLPLSE